MQFVPWDGGGEAKARSGMKRQNSSSSSGENRNKSNKSNNSAEFDRGLVDGRMSGP